MREKKKFFSWNFPETTPKKCSYILAFDDRTRVISNFFLPNCIIIISLNDGTTIIDSQKMENFDSEAIVVREKKNSFREISREWYININWKIIGWS